ncbi:MAG TPA: glycosyltransferase [Ignavibacteriaceae bacterium]|nr:glycosyltransferase [Ignavibacteriaceae bacterium]
MDMNICAVIVTYNNRFKLLNKVVDSLLKTDITKIIVVDNNSDKESKYNLSKLEKSLDGKLKICELIENTGSAGGYSKGLKEFHLDNDCHFVWLLDDDNLPELDALTTIKKFWNSISFNDKEKNIALLAYRKDRTIYYQAALKNKPDLTIGPKNTFLGFDLKTFLIKHKNKLLVFKNSDISVEYENKSFGEVSASYYGGIFFHKKLLEKIGYPNSDFFVYQDDIEFTSRISRYGGKIYVLFDSNINDIDENWNEKRKSESILKIPSVSDVDKFRLYYQLRNRIYFEKNFWTTNSLLFLINKIIYLFFLRINMLFGKNITHIKTIKIAIADGLKGNLGKRPNMFQ